jgi:hypothetical protein
LVKNISLAAMLVLTLAGCAIARQQQAASARQQYTDGIKQASAEAKAAILECKNKRLIGKLNTYVASVQCSNPRITDAFQRAGYRYMDLIGLLTAKRVEVAEKIDNHKITEAQGTLEDAEYISHIAAEDGHRNLEIINAQSNINHAAAQDDSTNRQIYLQMIIQDLI